MIQAQIDSISSRAWMQGYRPQAESCEVKPVKYRASRSPPHPPIDHRSHQHNVTASPQTTVPKGNPQPNTRMHVNGGWRCLTDAVDRWTYVFWRGAKFLRNNWQGQVLSTRCCGSGYGSRVPSKNQARRVRFGKGVILDIFSTVPLFGLRSCCEP